jgi:hypothetical protein
MLEVGGWARSSAGGPGRCAPRPRRLRLALGGQLVADRDHAGGRRPGEILGRRAWRCARRPRRRRLVLADQVGADRDPAARRAGEILGRRGLALRAAAAPPPAGAGRSGRRRSSSR